jgi:hypothetical protein
MELSKMIETKAQQYLKKGFFDSNGKLYQGINGEYSLGMAYRCRNEGTSPVQILKVVSQLESVFDSMNDSFKKNPNQRLDQEALNLWDQVNQSPEVKASKALSELFETSRSCVTTWKTYAALTIHLRRIMSQLALLTSLPT